jgi:magnesium-transporting ATPase (P-type)
MTANCLRLVLFAYKDFKSISSIDWKQEDDIIQGLTCLGIFGIEDPIRNEVPDAIQKCIRAGITVRMLTEDNIDTARAIAKKAGILNQKDDYLVLDGQGLNTKTRDRNGVVSCLIDLFVNNVTHLVTLFLRSNKNCWIKFGLNCLFWFVQLQLMNTIWLMVSFC